MLILSLIKNQLFLGAFTFDAPQPWQILFQDAATKIMDNITDLHHDIMFFPVLISTFVIYMMARIVTAYRISNTETVRTITVQHHTWMEVIWTLVPAVILMFIVSIKDAFHILYSYLNASLVKITQKKNESFVLRSSCLLFIDPRSIPPYNEEGEPNFIPLYDDEGNLNVNVDDLEDTNARFFLADAIGNSCWKAFSSFARPFEGLIAPKELILTEPFLDPTVGATTIAGADASCVPWLAGGILAYTGYKVGKTLDANMTAKPDNIFPGNQIDGWENFLTFMGANVLGAFTICIVGTIFAARTTDEPKLSVPKKMSDEYEPERIFTFVDSDDHTLLDFLPLIGLGTGTFLETVGFFFNGLFRIYWVRKVWKRFNYFSKIRFLPPKSGFSLSVMQISLLLCGFSSISIFFDPNLFSYNLPEQHTQFCLSWVIFMVNTNPELTETPVPVTAQVVPAGSVFQPPLFLGDPILPGPNFFNQLPFIQGLPNFWPVQIFTPPFFGGLVGPGFLVPLATQLAHGINPTAVPGAAINIPPFVPANLWPGQMPPIPEPFPDPNLTAGIVNAVPTVSPAFLWGGAILALVGATGFWAYHRKKGISLKSPENSSQFVDATNLDTMFKISLPADDAWKNVSRPTVFGANKANTLSLEMTYDSEFSFKFCGIPIKLTQIPFICLATSMSGHEIFTAIFMWLVRWYSFRLIRQQLFAWWNSFRFYREKSFSETGATYLKKATTLKNRASFFWLNLFFIKKMA